MKPPLRPILAREAAARATEEPQGHPQAETVQEAHQEERGAIHRISEEDEGNEGTGVTLQESIMLGLEIVDRMDQPSQARDNVLEAIAKLWLMAHTTSFTLQSETES